MDPSLMLLRELGARQLPASYHMPEGIARKLALETVLHGHDGCVNRLAWNEDGSFLASASDDCQVMLWQYPDTGRVPLALHTEHRANLFGVAFLPKHNNTRIISGAMDYTVQLHELEAGAFNIKPKYRSSSSSAAAAGSMRRHPQSQLVHRVVPRTTVFHCHKSRVKEVEVCAAEPSLFWSAGEDGMIRQYDTRVSDQKAYGSPNVLVNLTAAGPRQQLVECKGVDINHVHHHLMAVACGDPYVRVFDRRKLLTSRPGGCPSQPLLQLTCPHLPLLLKAGMNRRAHSTHVNFSNRGDRLVASFHGDHAYIFDISGAAEGVPIALRQQQQQQRRPGSSRSLRSHSPGVSRVNQIITAGIPGLSDPDQASQIAAAAETLDQSTADLAVPANLPAAAESSKVSGNSALFEQRYAAAVADFSAAIAAAPWVPGLYTQRALAYLKRGWEGDAVYALRDCLVALELVAQSRGGGAAAAAAEQQARMRQVHALKHLGQYQCGLAALDSYTRHYPQAADSSEVAALKNTFTRQIEQRQAYKAKLRAQRQQLRQRQQQQQQQQQSAATEAAARERFGVRQRQQQHSPAAAAAADLAGSSGGSSSRDVSPLGAPTQLLPPGPGFRVDTDLDSEELEDVATWLPESAAAAAPAGAAETPIAPPPPPPPPPAAAAGPVGMDLDVGAAAGEYQEVEGFIGPVLPPHMRRPAAAAAAAAAASESGSQQQQQQGSAHINNSNDAHEQSTAPTAAAAAAAAAAVARGRAVSHRIGVADLEADSDREVHSMNSDADSEDDGELQWLSSDTQDDSEDELLNPWYGPTTFIQEQVKAAAAAQQQQQQQNGSSGSRRRPRSSSDTGLQPDTEGHTSAAAAADRQQRRHRARHISNYHSPNGFNNHHNSYDNNHDSYDSHCDWWSSLSGGPGRLLQRCMGHCNVQTDIKEAVFVGEGDQLVACGSDDGRVFIYSTATGEAVRVLQADEDVANCVRCHPTLPVLATSGIDSVVRLWSPTAALDNSSCLSCVNANQSRMRDGPRLLRGAAIPPAALQAALDENPQLLQMLVQQLYGIGASASAASAAAPRPATAATAENATPAAGWNPRGEGLGPGDHDREGLGFGLGGESGGSEESEEGDGESRGHRQRQGQGEVACRVS